MATSRCNHMKIIKFASLFVAFINVMNAANAQEIETPVREKIDESLVFGVGAINGPYYLVKNAKRLIDADASYFLSLTKNRVMPLFYIKYENQLGLRHLLGLNFANSGLTVGGLVRDSAFLNDLGILTETQLDLTYRSRSVNLRYNYLISKHESFQVYLGLGLGIRGNSLSIKTNNPNIKNQLLIPGLNLASMPSIGFESTLGFRGLITPQWGWYSEVGIAKSFFQGGLSYRF